MRYFRTDDNKLLTMYDVVKTYLELKSNGNLADYEDFKTYLGACMYYNNGTLTEISKEDAKDIRVDVYYYGNAPYGTTICGPGKSYYEKQFYVKETIDNAKDINWDGVNFISVIDDENRIFQTSGYTEDRGLFCDLY